ncbi:DUF2075 domain-containing protein [bacterium SCSIO 12696]|nr:DUF2075 domain-containing protein [bacterium SCSIO 12696]
MIVYFATKREFVEDTVSNTIHEKIVAEVTRRGISGGSESEISSWRNSMQFMLNVVNDSELPDDAGVSIEYVIPLTSRRVDFILTGKDQYRQDTAVIIELKQWSSVAVTNKDGVVNTLLGGGLQDTSHPSYQAWTYAALIEDYNVTVREEAIALKPCAYLHNLDSDAAINDPFYQAHTNKAPVFISKDALKLNAFLKKYVRYGDTDDIMYRIEHGKIKPSKSLADSLASMLKGNTEFLMIDDQKLVYETALDLACNASTNSKQVLIVEGGPGTGKSVVAINLLVELTKRQLVAQYVSKNAAPRAVYSAHLKGTEKKSRIDNLFKGSASYTGVEPSYFDALIVDESHRLIEKNRYNKFSENQVKELIHAAKLTIFFIDEDQTVTWSDIGSKAEVHKWAENLGANVQELKLESQFRCNGSDGYLAWVDDALQVRHTANTSLEGIDYDFRVFDDPNEMRQAIREKNLLANKARMVAGYCWDWISDPNKKGGDVAAMDIVIPEHSFEAQWNLNKDGFTWIIAGNSVNEVGCIHTCQGLELDYVGVILGPDLVVRNGEVVTEATNRSKMDSSIKGYKKLFKEQPDAAREKADRIIKNTYRTLMTRGQKGCYLYSTDPETNEYFKAAVHQMAVEQQQTSQSKYLDMPLKLVDTDQVIPYENAVPIFDLKAAAGEFSEAQLVDGCDWVELPEPFAHKPGYFVVQVVGESMNKRIPNGSWCLFKTDSGGSRQGKIVLVQHSNIQCPELGGQYTVKSYHSEKVVSDDDTWGHQKIVLRPLTTVNGFVDIELIGDEIGSLVVVGEYVAVVG